MGAPAPTTFQGTCGLFRDIHLGTGWREPRTQGLRSDHISDQRRGLERSEKTLHHREVAKQEATVREKSLGYGAAPLVLSAHLDLFSDEETKAQRRSDLPKATWLRSDRARTRTSSLAKVGEPQLLTLRSSRRPHVFLPPLFLTCSLMLYFLPVEFCL